MVASHTHVTNRNGIICLLPSFFICFWCWSSTEWTRRMQTLFPLAFQVGMRAQPPHIIYIILSMFLESSCQLTSYYSIPNLLISILNISYLNVSLGKLNAIIISYQLSYCSKSNWLYFCGSFLDGCIIPPYDGMKIQEEESLSPRKEIQHSSKTKFEEALFSSPT